jgi:hypothetical protein
MEGGGAWTGVVTGFPAGRGTGCGGTGLPTTCGARSRTAVTPGSTGGRGTSGFGLVFGAGGAVFASGSPAVAGSILDLGFVGAAFTPTGLTGEILAVAATSGLAVVTRTLTLPDLALAGAG